MPPATATHGPAVTIGPAPPDVDMIRVLVLVGGVDEALVIVLLFVAVAVTTTS